MGPSADDVAIAIVAACRETGDNPVETLEGRGAMRGDTNRARHYALHALCHVFPKVNRFSLCKLVGCPGKPGAFWNASWNQIVKPRYAGSPERMAKWWDEALYDRVIRALEADRTRRAVTPPAKDKPEPPPYRSPPGTYQRALASGPKRPNLGTLEESGYRPPASAVEKALDDDAEGDRPIFDHSSSGGFRKPRQDTFGSSRRAAEDMLREAVANTARMQVKE